MGKLGIFATHGVRARSKRGVRAGAVRPRRSPSAGFVLAGVAALGLVVPGLIEVGEARAQQSPTASVGARDTGAAAVVETPLEEAERAAQSAEAAASEARALFERIREAQQSGAPAATNAAEGSREGPKTGASRPDSDGVRGAPVDPTADPTAQRAIEEAERAAREARAAAEEARRAAEEARSALQQYRDRYARKGILIGGAVFYSVEDFETSLSTSNSRGASLFVGYRVHRHVSIEVRGELLDDYDLRADDPSESAFDAQLDGFLVTAGPKFYPFTGSLQPFVGIGVGGMRARLRGLDADGLPINLSESDMVVRFAGGLDYFLSMNVVLNLEAAYVAAGGDLQQIDFATFNGGVTLRF